MFGSYVVSLVIVFNLFIEWKVLFSSSVGCILLSFWALMIALPDCFGGYSIGILGYYGIHPFYQLLAAAICVISKL